MMTEVNIREKLRGVNFYNIRLEYIVKSQNAYNKYKSIMKDIIDANYIDENGILSKKDIKEAELRREADVYFKLACTDYMQIVGICNTLIDLVDNGVRVCSFTDNEIKLINKLINISKESPVEY